MFKWFFAVFLIVAVILGIYPFLLSDPQKQELTGLPWQIESRDDGTSRVFGVTIGQSTLASARDVLGDDMEMAIVVQGDEAGSLEMYYGHYKAGLLGGKMVLQAEADEDQLKRWRDNAARYDYMASGNAKRFYLAESDLPSAFKARVSGISFIPAVNLDEDIVLARFGDSGQRIEKDGVVHFLYPEKGLHIAIADGGKDVLQYVEPARFDRLSAPFTGQ